MEFLNSDISLCDCLWNEIKSGLRHEKGFFDFWNENILSVECDNASDCPILFVFLDFITYLNKRLCLAEIRMQ